MLSVVKKESHVTTTKPQPEPSEEEAEEDWCVTVHKPSTVKPEPKYLILPEIDIKVLRKIKRVSKSDEVSRPKISNSCQMKRHLHNLKTILLYSNVTPFKNQDGINYVCNLCKQKYPVPADLKAHVLETHSDDEKSKYMHGLALVNFVVRLDITGLKCTICDCSVDGITQLLNHFKGHGKDVFTDVVNRFIPFKFDRDGLYCIHCSKVFDNFKNAYQHMSVHYRNYVCDLCATPFITEQNLRRHRLIHDTGEFKCDYCPKVFDTHTKKLSHHSYYHLSGGKRNKCPYCNEKFSMYSKRLDHMVKEHGVEPIRYDCNACDRSFKMKALLVRHIRKDHLLEKSYQCDECDLSFFKENHLNLHKITHGRSKNFRCNVCFKLYARRRSLREHLRIHTNDRRFKCEHCGLTFIQKCNMKSHMKTKHGDVTVKSE